MEKVAIFIDGANFSTTANVLGFSIDYEKLLNYFSSQYRVVRSYFYTATLSLPDGSINRRTQIEWLSHHGYTPRHKPSKQFEERHYCPNCSVSFTKYKVKGNMDMEMAVDIIRTAPLVDRIILFTGDGDFRSLLQYVQEDRGVQVTVVSTRKASVLSEDLRRQADQFIDLELIRDAISRFPNNRAPVIVERKPIKSLIGLIGRKRAGE